MLNILLNLGAFSPPEPGICYDDSIHCREYAADGKCAIDVLHRYANFCKRSCGLCSTYPVGVVVLRLACGLCSTYPVGVVVLRLACGICSTYPVGVVVLRLACGLCSMYPVGVVVLRLARALSCRCRRHFETSSAMVRVIVSF